MPINITGKPKAPPAQENSEQEADLSTLGGATPPSEGQAETGADNAAETPQEGQETPGGTTPQNQNVQAPGHQTGASYLMTGSQQRSQVDQIKTQQELRSKLRGGAKRFWINPGEFAKLYFLDGKLLDDDVFDTPMIATHMMQIGGDWVRFVCNKATEGQCIVCDSNADRSQPQTFQLFTVINVMPYKIQNGPNKGKTLPARLQLLAATLKAREKLIMRAKNHGGVLAGAIYQFTRQTKQEPDIGGDIEFIQEVPMQGVLQKYPMLGSVYDQKKKEWKDAPTTVIDYAKAFPVVTNDDIAALRPDLASMAGYSGGYAPGMSPNTGFGTDPTQAVDDEIPF